jgi:hypothetical protein
MADPGSASQPDTVWLGLGKNATEAAAAAGDADFFLIEVPLGANVPTALSDAHVIDTETVITPESFRAFTNDASDTTWTLDLAPTWVTTDLIRYWVGDGTTPHDWAVSVKIDLAAAGIDPPGGGTPTLDAKLFVAGFVETSFGQGWVHQWPTNAVFIDLTGNPDVVSPYDQTVINPTNWGQVTFPASFSTPCTDGIRLSFMQIGADPPPENLINVPTGASTADNLYFARPDWSGWGAVVTNAVKARFRIANWGSMIADPAAPWTEAANNVLNNASGNMEFNCPVGTALCGVLPAGDNHQCMLVELSKGTASTVDPLKFASDSVYRNMDFDDTSTLVRQAEINIKGLKPLPGAAKRDTYLYVKTVNMPAPTPEQLFLPRDEMYRAVKVAKHPLPGPRQPPKPDKPGERPGVVPKAPPAAKAQKPPDPPPLDPDLAKDAYDHLADSWPTYEVHAYHDTGSFIAVRGKKYRLIKPMVPFGYFLDHTGPYFGFEHKLEGIEGTKLTQIGPSFYKLEIVNDGVAKVKSTITALEKPGGKPMCDCQGCCQPPPVKVEINPRCHCRIVEPGSTGGLAAAFGGLFALGFVAVARRRRRRRLR